MKKLVLLLALAFAVIRRATARPRALEAAGRQRHHRPRRLGHRARPRQDRRRRRLRHDLRPGRGRFQSRRDQLPQLHGPPRRGRGRIAHLSGPAHEALHRSRRPQEAVRRQPRLAQVADERLGRRPELLSRHPPRREAARHPALRTLDGPLLHRRQHRRRYREDQSQPARSPSTARSPSPALAAPQTRSPNPSPPAPTAWRSRPPTPPAITRCC